MRDLSAFAIAWFFLWFSPLAAAQPKALIDPVNPTDGWEAIASDGVRIELSADPEHPGAIRIDYDFTAGSGFGLIQRTTPMTLAPNYRFDYHIQGAGPANDLEFKLLDDTLDSVWWVNRRAFVPPAERTPIAMKRRHFEFAWGPLEGNSIQQLGVIEFAVAASQGGKGAIYIDSLTYEAIPLERPYDGIPLAKDPANPNDRGRAVVGDCFTWDFRPDADGNALELDFGVDHTISHITIDWNESTEPFAYSVQAARDGQSFREIARIDRSLGGPDHVVLSEIDATRLRLSLDADTDHAPTLTGIAFFEPDEINSTNAAISMIAESSPRGQLPQIFTGRQTFWTILGTESHQSEALFSEHGSLELDKGGFTIEPFIETKDATLTWAEATHQQSLAESELPMPTVRRTHDGLELTIEPVAVGDARVAHVLTRYTVKNTSPKDFDGRLVLAARPIQVLPPSQWLNLVGGFTPIRSIDLSSHRMTINKTRSVEAWTPADASYAWDLRDTPLAHSDHTSVANIESTAGFAAGAWAFAIDLAPGETRSVILAAGLADESGTFPPAMPLPPEPLAMFESLQQIKADHWREVLNRVTLNLPDHAADLEHSLRSTLAYILINRDGPAIQPGSRTYERAWIRDGAITGASLIALGHADAMRSYIDWYAPYQYPSGKVPCVVDRRGPDPVDEHDSSGQLIFAIARYADATGDTSVLHDHFHHVVAAVGYMSDLIDQRSTSEYAGTAYFGLVPESISHEGYSAKPMHSYWDGMFVLQGLRDAAWIAGKLGRTETQQEWLELAETFQRSLHNSIVLAAQEQNIDYIPGCVELGDFDPTSTAVALGPLSVADALPQHLLRNTMDQYWEWYEARQKGDREWRDYTPYEMRVIGAMAALGERDRAEQMTDWFLTQQTPTGWNQWPEIVYEDLRYTGFLGDLPHTWCGAGLINSFTAGVGSRAGNERVFGIGIPASWYEAPEGFAIRGLVTPAGEVDFVSEWQEGELLITLTSEERAEGKLLSLPVSIVEAHTVRVNGQQVHQADQTSSSVLVPIR